MVGYVSGFGEGVSGLIWMWGTVGGGRGGVDGKGEYHWSHEKRGDSRRMMPVGVAEEGSVPTSPWCGCLPACLRCPAMSGAAQRSGGRSPSSLESRGLEEQGKAFL